MSPTTTPTFAPVQRTVLDYRASAVYMGMDLDGRSDESIRRALNRLVDKQQLQPTVVFGHRVFRITDLNACLDRLAGPGGGP